MTRLGVFNTILHFSLPEEVIGITTSFATREENDIITNVYNANARHTIQGGYYCPYHNLVINNPISFLGLSFACLFMGLLVKVLMVTASHRTGGLGRPISKMIVLTRWSK